MLNNFAVMYMQVRNFTNANIILQCAT
jgi:hypothetical protein